MAKLWPTFGVVVYYSMRDRRVWCVAFNVTKVHSRRCGSRDQARPRQPPSPSPRIAQTRSLDSPSPLAARCQFSASDRSRRPVGAARSSLSYLSRAGQARPLQPPSPSLHIRETAAFDGFSDLPSPKPIETLVRVKDLSMQRAGGGFNTPPEKN